jgi:hypothetical protein
LKNKKVTSKSKNPYLAKYKNEKMKLFNVQAANKKSQNKKKDIYL